MNLSARMSLVLLLASIARPFPAEAAQASDPIATPPPASAPVTLLVRTTGGTRQFRPGAIITIELEFNSTVPKRFVVDGATYDRGGRLTIDEFTIEPNAAVSDPLLDYFAWNGGSLGGLRSMGVLDGKPYTVRLELNEWFRFDEPGSYELSVRSRRVTDEARRTSKDEPIVPVASNSVAFEILARDPDWEAAELRRALAILDSNGSDVERRNGCRMLRFLATDAAIDEMVRRFDDGQWGCEFEYMAGLVGAADRERVLRQMEAGLRASEQPITRSYLQTVALVSLYARRPEFRIPQTRDTKGRLVAPPGDRTRHADLLREAEARYTEILVAALPDKTDRARATTLSTLLELSQQPAPTGASSRVALPDTVRSQLTATFRALPPERQRTLLEHQWQSLAGPEMVPVLRRIVEGQGSASAPLGDLALRRLYELSPEQGRSLILREIVNPRPEATLETLGMLPDRELAALDAILAGNVDPDLGFDAFSIRAELLQRYATAAVAQRVLTEVEPVLPRMACRPHAALLAYFVRAIPDMGRTLIDRALDSRTLTGCYQSVLRDIAALHMTSAVEAAALAHLDDPDAQVAINAIETLGRFGTPAAYGPLRKQFESWHEAWQGRDQELRYSRANDRPAAVQGMVELTYLQALARGQAWFAGTRDLGELRSLCVTDNCRTQADHMVDAAADTTVKVLRVNGPGDALAMVGHYHLPSMSALEQKLQQYPKGTVFTLETGALDPRTASVVAAELLKFAAANGIALRR